MKLDKKLVGIRIMQRRKEFGLTQDALSEQIGISKNHLSSIERGVNIPTTQTIFQICNVLGHSPDYYLIGKLSKEGTRALKLIQSMPVDSQKIVLRLIETYLNEIDCS